MPEKKEQNEKNLNGARGRYRTSSPFFGDVHAAPHVLPNVKSKEETSKNKGRKRNVYVRYVVVDYAGIFLLKKLDKFSGVHCAGVATF